MLIVVAPHDEGLCDRFHVSAVVVIRRELDLPSENPAPVVRMLDAELVAAKLVLAEGRERSPLICR